jgi:hypothetical protein
MDFPTKYIYVCRYSHFLPQNLTFLTFAKNDALVDILTSSPGRVTDNSDKMTWYLVNLVEPVAFLIGTLARGKLIGVELLNT